MNFYSITDVSQTDVWDVPRTIRLVCVFGGVRVPVEINFVLEFFDRALVGVGLK